jgi:hypothetical protein
MTYDEWISIGINNNWCGPAVCYMHDGLPTTPYEDEQLDEGYDPCIHIIRMYDTPETRTLIENNHSPSLWRNHTPK